MIKRYKFSIFASVLSVMLALYAGANIAAENAKVLDYSDTNGHNKTLYTNDFKPVYQINPSPEAISFYFSDIQTWVNLSQQGGCNAPVGKVTTYQNDDGEWQEDEQVGDLAYGPVMLEPAKNVYYYLNLDACSNARILELQL